MAKPFVKWAGGKSKVLEQLVPLLPKNITSNEMIYVEPFVGGGAMTFYMLKRFPNIKRVIINDINKDLINCYDVVARYPEELIRELQFLEKRYYSLKSEDRKRLFLYIREEYNMTHEYTRDKIYLAAMFIFLNKTCFNGLYRVNKSGMFNTSFGKYENPLICDYETILEDSKLLSNVSMDSVDFENILSIIPSHEKEVFFYLDPPYYPVSDTSCFTEYAKGGFDEGSNKRLLDFCYMLNGFKYKFLLNNSYVKNNDEEMSLFEKMYSDFNISHISAKRSINSDGQKRGTITELAICNYYDMIRNV
jgi:DNA adenine methylase